jgi:hypothetical protein
VGERKKRCRPERSEGPALDDARNKQVVRCAHDDNNVALR